jgi:hypothetical protein
MTSVCAACRDSKVKCELLDQPGLQSCARCARIGLKCEPAEPSMRGKRSSTSRLGELNKKRLHGDSTKAESTTSMSSVTSKSECTGTSEFDQGRFLAFWTEFVDGPGAVQNNRYVAIQKAGRARLYNRPDYMAMSMALCAHYGYCVEDVIANSVLTGSTQPMVDDYPPPMACMLRASSGYATGRSAAGGVVTCVANASFEAAVMTARELDAAASDPRLPCADLFGFRGSAYVHPDDTHITERFTGQMISASFDKDTVFTMEIPGTVRVTDRRMRCYVPCSARGMVQFGGCPTRP